jgi:hypothetical protein
MRFHTERDKRLHPMRDVQMQAPPPVSSKSAFQDNGIVDDLLVISMCYEAHLSMQQMLAVFSEMREGDDALPSG